MWGFYYFQKSGQIGAGFLFFSKNLAKNGGVFIYSLDFFQILGFFSIKWSQKFSRASRAWGVFIILKIFPRFARGFYYFQKNLAKSSRVLIFSLIRGGFIPNTPVVMIRNPWETFKNPQMLNMGR